MAEPALALEIEALGSERWTVLHGSMLDVLPTLPENSLDCLVCDPPYELGFMSKSWDRSGIAFRVETWAAVLRVLKPGAHAVVFGGTRTMHRIACAAEDAGFEVRDYLEWMYGSGFPKSLNVSKAIDAHLGAERPVIGKQILTGTAALSTKDKGGTFSAGIASDGHVKEVELTAAGSPEAAEWDGWGTALKPGHEPIYLLRKPLEKGLTVAENVLKWGTGAINIDAGRVAGAVPQTTQGASTRIYGGGKGFSAVQQESHPHDAGRWPPNVLLTHSAACRKLGTSEVKANPTWDTPNRNTAPSSFTGAEVSKVRHANGRDGEASAGARRDDVEAVDVWECADDCPVREMDRQTGELRSGFMAAGTTRGTRTGYSGHMPHATAADTIADSGSASRFFPQSQWDPELDDIATFYYCAKAARAERDQGLEYFRARTAAEATDSEDGQARLNSPRTGAGRTGGARNPHPTVKPVELLKWLARLICPPKGAILDPFAGSGSAGMAAVLEGFRYVGVELNDSDDEPFVSVARARISWAEGRTLIPRESLRAAEPPRQVGLFEVSK